VLDECQAIAVATLSMHRDSSTPLAHALLIQETLDEADAYRIAGVDRQPNGGTPAHVTMAPA
jgi:cell division protease FtsH